MVHAVTLLAILLFAAPMAKFIPLTVLAAILFVVAYNMGEWREIPELLKLSKLEVGTWLLTFLLTVFADLTVAVEAGMIMGALVFISKVTRTTKISRVTADYVAHGRRHILQDKEIPPYVAIFRIHGPFLFGAADKMETVIEKLPELPPVIILRLRNMTAIDATGLQKLEHFADVVHGAHKALLLCGALEQPAQLMKQAEFEEHVGKYNICGSIEDALERAREVYEEMCATQLAEPDHGQKTDELAEQRHDL
jgi:SulP family sulfate permease